MFNFAGLVKAAAVMILILEAVCFSFTTLLSAKAANGFELHRGRDRVERNRYSDLESLVVSVHIPFLLALALIGFMKGKHQWLSVGLRIRCLSSGRIVAGQSL